MQIYLGEYKLQKVNLVLIKKHLLQWKEWNIQIQIEKHYLIQKYY